MCRVAWTQAVPNVNFILDEGVVGTIQGSPFRITGGVNVGSAMCASGFEFASAKFLYNRMAVQRWIRYGLRHHVWNRRDRWRDCRGVQHMRGGGPYVQESRDNEKV